MSIPQLDKMDVSGISNITTSFRAGVDSTLKPVHAAAVEATEALTAFRSNLTNKINDTLSALTGNLLTINDLASFVTVDNGRISFNQQEMISRVQRATGLNVSTLDGFTDTITGKIFDEINQVSNGMLGQIIDKNGNVVLLDTLSSDNDIGKLTRLVDRYLDSQGKPRDQYNYYDRISNDVVSEQLIRQTAEVGNYEDVRSLYDSADDTTKPKLATALVAVLKTVGNNGDFRTAAVITDIVTVQRARSALPGLVTMLFRAYRIPRYLKETEYNDEANRLLQFADIYSPGWRHGEYHGKVTEMLTMWMQTGSGLVKLFSRSPDYAPLVYLGGKFVQKSTMGLLKDRWPDLAVVELVGTRIGR